MRMTTLGWIIRLRQLRAPLQRLVVLLLLFILGLASTTVVVQATTSSSSSCCSCNRRSWKGPASAFVTTWCHQTPLDILTTTTTATTRSSTTNMGAAILTADTMAPFVCPSRWLFSLGSYSAVSRRRRGGDGSSSSISSLSSSSSSSIISCASSSSSPSLSSWGWWWTQQESSPRQDNDGSPNLVVLIPAYNEESRIGDTLRSYHAYLRQDPQWNNGCARILVSNDGSIDRTVQVVQDIAHELETVVSSSLSLSSPSTNIPIDCVSLPTNQGKGAALAFGIQEIARQQQQQQDTQQQDTQPPPTTLILTTDADGSAPPHGIQDMYQRLITYFQQEQQQQQPQRSTRTRSTTRTTPPVVVTGYRTYNSTAPSRLLFRWGFRTLVQWICGTTSVFERQLANMNTTTTTRDIWGDDNSNNNNNNKASRVGSGVVGSGNNNGLGVRDTQCGFKLYSSIETAQLLYQDLHLMGWSHDVEVLYRARYKYNIPLLEQVTEWNDDQESRTRRNNNNNQNNNNNNRGWYFGCVLANVVGCCTIAMEL